MRQLGLLLVAGLAGCVAEQQPARDACDPSGGVICTVAGTGRAGFAGDDGPALDADLFLPMDVVVAPDGDLVIVDWKNDRLRLVGEGGVIRTVATVERPTSAAFDAEGRLVIAAWQACRIQRLDLAGGPLEDVAGTGRRGVYAGDGGPALAADLDLPAAVALAPDGQLYLMDQANQVIRRVDARGDIHRFAGRCVVDRCEPGQLPAACPGSDKTACDPSACDQPCTGGFAGDGGHALDARLSQPFGQTADPAGRIAFDAEGNLYFADTRNRRVRRVDRQGRIDTVAGGLDGPTDVVVGDDGTIYIADAAASCVRAVDPTGAMRTLAGICGEIGTDGDGGPAVAAHLDHPHGLDLDRQRGLLYIADTGNSSVRVISVAD